MNAVPQRRPVPGIPTAMPEIVPPSIAERLETTWSLGPHPAALQANARRWRQALEPYAAPVSEPVVRAWLMPIVASVINPPEGDEMRSKIAALMLTLDGVPTGAFTVATRRDLMRACKHWPSGAEVYAAVQNAELQIRLTMAGLDRMINAKTEG